MGIFDNPVVSPWEEFAAEGISLGSGTDLLLIVGAPGSLPVECAREIHRNAGSGPFEWVICTPKSDVMGTQLLGPLMGLLPEFDAFDSTLPPGAIMRAVGGTLFLDSLDRCHPEDINWLRDLCSRRRVTIDGYSMELDSSTRIIASVTVEWMDQFESQVPQWVMALSEGRNLVIEPLGNRSGDVQSAAQWFAYDAQGHTSPPPFTNEGLQIVSKRDWPGDLEELRRVVRSVVSVSAGGTATREVLDRVLAEQESPGMHAVDSNRQRQCYTYSLGMHYMGRQINSQEVYQWISQFSKVSRDTAIDPWVVGLTMVKAIADKYYYSADYLRSLIRKAYLSLCAELATNGYMPKWVSGSSADSLPSPQAILVNPLGPLKSASGVMPHIAHLLGRGNEQIWAPVEDVAGQLAKNRETRLILFCDDFSGTGRQIATQLVQEFASNKELQHICEKRRNDGSPVALGVILGIGFDVAVDRIAHSGPDWLPVMVHTGDRLDDKDRAFSDDSLVFPEKPIRDRVSSLVMDLVGKQLYRRWPGGWGNSQALVVTADNVPNNTLPAICMSGSVEGVPWKSLFERSSTPR